jgi:hypothetical protein
MALSSSEKKEIETLVRKEIKDFLGSQTVKQFENKLNEYSTDYIVYLYRKIFFPLVDRLNDNIIIHDNIINNIDELENKIKNNEIERDKLIEISVFYLSKYILKLYDKLFCTKFMKYYQYGWLHN